MLVHPGDDVEEGGASERRWRVSSLTDMREDAMERKSFEGDNEKEERGEKHKQRKQPDLGTYKGR